MKYKRIRTGNKSNELIEVPEMYKNEGDVDQIYYELVNAAAMMSQICADFNNGEYVFAGLRKVIERIEIILNEFEEL